VPARTREPRRGFWLPIDMSFSHGKTSKDYHKALQSFAESNDVSDEESEDGFDIVESSRKTLDLSQYIEGKWMLRSSCQSFIINTVQPSRKHKLSRKMLVEHLTVAEPKVKIPTTLKFLGLLKYREKHLS
jgi:hypothetical protein